MDGMAYDQTKHLKNVVENQGKGRLFKIECDFYRQSAAIHEAYFTGSFSRNFLASPMNTDNILHQLKNSGNKVNYIAGQNYPVLDLSQSNSPNSTFDLISGDSGSIFNGICPNQGLFFRDSVYSFEEYNSTEEIYTFIDKEFNSTYNLRDFDHCMKDNKILTNLDLLYYTSGTDHYNHGFGKNHHKTIGVMYGIEKNIIHLMKFIDEHPEFLLIVSSDHGGQKFYGEDNFCNHGCQVGDNKGFLFIYSKDYNEKGIKLAKEVDEIGVLKFAPTISQVLKGVNIPHLSLESPERIFESCKRNVKARLL